MVLIDARQHVTNPRGRFKVPKGDIIGKAAHHSVSGGTFFMAGQTTAQDEINHIRMIDAYHVSIDFGGFAYHTCAFPSGRAYQTGDFDGARAHIWGRNHELLGWVLIGDYQEQLPSGGGMAAAAECERAFDAYLGRQVPLKGHIDWALAGHGTACPGRVRERLTTIRNLAKEDDMLTPEDKAWLLQLRTDGLAHIDRNADARKKTILDKIAAFGGGGSISDADMDRIADAVADKIAARMRN